MEFQFFLLKRLVRLNLKSNGLFGYYPCQICLKPVTGKITGRY
jgi:hypothetical protein